MTIGASMFFQSEEDLNRLINFRGLKLQLSFMRAKYLDLFLDKNYIKELQKHNIEVISVHAPTLKIHNGAKFAKTTLQKCIGLISPSVKTRPFLITLHPQVTPIPDDGALYDLSQWAWRNGINICWEMFPTKRGKWAKTVFELNELANSYQFYSITYDTSHVDDPYWMHPLTWNHIKNNVSIIHYSVKPKTPISMGFKEPLNQKNLRPTFIKEHCYMDYNEPAYDNKEFLNTVKKSDWNGLIILEYMPHYDNYMIDDVKKLEKFFHEDRK